MVKRTIATVLAAAGLLVVAGAVEAQNYSDRSLRGSYIFRGDGTVTDVDAPSVGRIVYDGEGGCTSRFFLNFGGTLLQFNTDAPGGSCSYSVTSKGSGRLDGVYRGPQGLVEFNGQMMLVDDGASSGEVFWTATDPDGQTVGRGVIKKQRPGVNAQNFSERSLRGTWVHRTTGTVQGIDTPGVGRGDFDGAGSCGDGAVRWVLVFGGPTVGIGPGGTCTYTVSPQGLYRSSFVGSLANGAPAAFDWVGYIVDDTDGHAELWSVIVDPAGSTVGRGVSKRQQP